MVTTIATTNSLRKSNFRVRIFAIMISYRIKILLLSHLFYKGYQSIYQHFT